MGRSAQGANLVDIAYTGQILKDGELEHRYGPGVHLLSDPYHLSLLSTLGAETTTQPLLNQLVVGLYRDLIASVAARELPQEESEVPTRMVAHTDRGVYRGRRLRRDTQVVCVDLARAGILPAGVCFDALNLVLDPAGVRQDHLVMNRVTDEDGTVTGARIFGEKTGGDVSGRVVLFPDPMGATGSSLLKAIQFYEDQAGARDATLIVMNLIVTPEFIQNVKAARPEVIIYAYRLDRGLSDPEVLASVPGTYPDRECGLTDNQYIVPGAGGLGEVINNVFV